MSDPRHWTAMNAARAKIAALCTAGDLPGISSSNVQMLLLPHIDKAIKQRSLGLPAIVLSPVVAESINSNVFGITGTNIDDAYGYPVTVAIVDAAEAPALFGELKVYLGWRETLLKAFHKKPVDNDASFVGTAVEPMDVVSLNAWVGSALFASGFIVRTVSRETVR